MSFLSREDKPEHPLEGCLFPYGNILWNEDISIVSNFFFSPSDDFLIIMFLFAGKTDCLNSGGILTNLPYKWRKAGL